MSTATPPVEPTVPGLRGTTEPEESLGKPISGPTALGDDPRRLLRLAWTLAVTDFRLRFFDSALGYAWTLVRPLMLFGVLYVVFSTVFNLGNEVKYYPVALLLGIVMNVFFNEATGQAVRSLLLRESLVRKVDFPRLAVPMATVLTAFFNLCLSIIPVFVFLYAAGGSLNWRVIELPFLLVGLALFAFGCALSLSALFIRYRDVEPIWDVFLQAFFYASPIIYPIEKLLADKSVPRWVPRAMEANPFTALLQQARHAVIDPSHLTAAQALGQTWRLLIPVAIGLIVLGIGYRIFAKAAPRIAEEL